MMKFKSFLRHFFWGSLISFSANSLLTAASHDRAEDYGYSSSGESTVTPALNHAERRARRYTAERHIAVPDVYLHVPESGKVFSIAGYIGSAKVLRQAYRKFVSTVQSAQNVAMIGAESGAGSHVAPDDIDDHMVAIDDLPEPNYRTRSPLAELSIVGPADGIVRATSVSSTATTVAPPGWMESLPADLHTVFDVETSDARLSMAGDRASGSRRRTIAASGHARLVRALSQAAAADGKMSDEAGARAKRVKKRRPKIEDLSMAEFLRYKFDSSDSEDGHAKLPKCTS